MKKILVLAVTVSLFSCNNAKHMAKVYPDGYWMKGQYLSNHNYPQAKADSIAWLNK